MHMCTTHIYINLNKLPIALTSNTPNHYYFRVLPRNIEISRENHSIARGNRLEPNNVKV